MPRNHVILGGAPEGYDARLILRELERRPAPVLHVARDDKRMAAMRAALAFFSPDTPVIEFPGWDCPPYDRVSPNADISARRMASLATLCRGLPEARDGSFVAVTTLNAATQRIPARETLKGATWNARVGERIDENALRKFLVRMGFSKSPTVTEPGDYAIRGGIVDIFPPGRAEPVRLDMFGDVLDGARRFDPVTQRTTGKLERIDLAPVSEVILDDAAMTRFRRSYRMEFGAAGSGDPVYEAIGAGRRHQGIEHWLPLCQERLETLFDYLPDASVWLDERVESQRLARWETVTDRYETRKITMEAGNRADTVYRPVSPERLYLNDSAWQAAVSDRRVVNLSAMTQDPGAGFIHGGGRIGRDFMPERQDENISIFKILKDHIEVRRQEGAVVVASYSEGARERLQSLLRDEGLEDIRLAGDYRDIPEAPGGAYLTVWPLEHGFECKGLTVVSEQDVLGDRLIRAPGRGRKAENFLTETRSLSPGDLVVHVEHGIGRFNGLETVTAMGAPHECIALEYAGGDRLFLPVENMELLSRFGGDKGIPDRLGSVAWQTRKARLKKRIKEIAGELIRIAAERTLRSAKIMEPPEGAWDAFCARFPYLETDDQLSAIADVLEDMASSRPMDRLVCGDVGFGKTEIAMRAAFVAAMSGAQVALIAPTTLLARQHYQSFSERFRGSPLRVCQLSRFVGKKEAAATRAGLADGSASIVIGTHALLSKGIRFGNLGLLIVDEEQHFGVTHKERLKQLRSDVHVLTLTATPIPRTLQMSLSGVRDLSVIGTPPVDRLSIRTYICEFDAVTIRDALLREHYRRGQSFFVVPRIGDLSEIEEFLTDQVPETSFVTVHGRLAAGEIDRRMTAFYEGKCDVLLATGIVESGLDIPSANTMIVHRADMFGLAQLYQIRGRVGRSKTRAYAYLTTKPRAPLTVNAEKRLRILGSLDTLGAGFTLASQDLDIRGAGNLIGAEQSGRIREVGYELYQSMLEEAIASLRTAPTEDPGDDDGQWTPQINLGVPVLIPEDYVPDLDVRLGLYRRLSRLETRVELEGFAAELIDRFGKMPREVNILLLVVRVKAMCIRAGVARLDGGPRGATIRFRNNRFANPQGLVEFIEDQRGMAKVRDNRIIVRRDWKRAGDRIRGAFAIVRDLAEKAESGSDARA